MEDELKNNIDDEFEEEEYEEFDEDDEVDNNESENLTQNINHLPENKTIFKNLMKEIYKEILMRSKGEYLILENNIIYDSILFLIENNLFHWFLKNDIDDINLYQYLILLSKQKEIMLIKKLYSKNLFNFSYNMYCEGLPILHLSLSYSEFEVYHDKCSLVFQLLIEEFYEFLNEEDELMQYENKTKIIIKKIFGDYLDRLGRNIFHLIIKSDNLTCLNILFKFFDSNLIEDYLLNKDFDNNSSLNYLIIYRSYNCLKYLLENSNFLILIEKSGKKNNTIITYIINNYDFYALKIIDDFYSLFKESKEYNGYNNIINIVKKQLENSLESNKQNNKLKTIKLFFINNLKDYEIEKFKYNKSLIITHPLCYEHTKIKYSSCYERHYKRINQVENSDRLVTILGENFGCLKTSLFKDTIDIIISHKKVNISDVSRIHAYSYINHIKSTCNKIDILNNVNSINYDRDSMINKNTFDAAIQAAGCAIDACEKIINGNYKNGFIPIRPPGHHAGYFGKTDENMEDEKTTNGFCFFNNIVICAAYLRYNYGLKVAIVDFDVHHGNGTQELIKNLTGNNKIKFKKESMFGNYQAEINICTPWLNFEDKKEILFISLHGYDDSNPNNFYPCSGNEKENTKVTDDDIFPGGILNIPLNKSSKYSPNYRNEFREKALMRLHLFKPDFILVSAGFDGHENEDINGNYSRINEFDYSFIMKELINIANLYGDGKILSILEGGYNIHKGIISSFSQSITSHMIPLINNNKFEIMKKLYYDSNNNDINNKKEKQIGSLKFLNRKHLREYKTDMEIFNKSKKIKEKVFGYKYEEEIKSISIMQRRRIKFIRENK